MTDEHEQIAPLEGIRDPDEQVSAEESRDGAVVHEPGEALDDVPPEAAAQEEPAQEAAVREEPAEREALEETRQEQAAPEEPAAESAQQHAAAEDGSGVADPFAGWPQAESATVIEDAPEEGAAVEHVRGEIDVPGGYTVIEGTPLGHRRTVAVVVSRYNGGLTNRLLARALETLDETGVSADAITIVPVPGAFELPLAAMALAKTRRYACVVALGAVVRGETPHFDFVASEAASGLQLAAIETGIPVAFGVLTLDTVEQAEARIDRAADAVRSALEMADVFAQLRATAAQ
jgi:6,7-dimethyl-8-ribityllumazine synthase